jgi:hypothetical protein
MAKLDTMDAIVALARFIETQAAKDLADCAADPSSLDAIAAEYCTTRDVLVRSLQIGTAVSMLIDNLDWPVETKLACREFIANMGQKDLAWQAGLRRRQNALN